MIYLPRGFRKIATGAVFGQIVSLACYPVIGQLYSPAAFGIFATLSSIAAVLATFASCRCEMAIISAAKQREALHLLVAGLACSVATVTAISLICLALYASRWIDSPWLSPPLVLIGAATVLATACMALMRGWALRASHFTLVGRATLCQHVTRAGVACIGGVILPHWYWLLGGSLAARTGSTLLMLWRHWSDLRRSLRLLSLRELRRCVMKYQRYWWIGTPDAVADSLAALAPVPIVTALYGSGSTGQFALAFQVASLPVILLAASLGEAFHCDLRTRKQARQPLTRTYLRTLLSLALVALLPLAVLSVIGGYLFELVFGSEWSEAGQLAQVLCFWTFAAFVVAPVSRMVYVLDGQPLKLAYSVMTLSLSTLALWLCHFWGGSVYAAVGWLTLCQVGCYLFYGLLLLQLVTSYDRRHSTNSSTLRSEAAALSSSPSRPAATSLALSSPK